MSLLCFATGKRGKHARKACKTDKFAAPVCIADKRLRSGENAAGDRDICTGAGLYCSV